MKKRQQRTRAALRATAVQSCVLPRKAKFSDHGLPAMHPTSRASHQPCIPPALPPGGAGTTQCHSQDHAAWLLIPNTGFSNSLAYGPKSQAGASTLLWHHCLVTQKAGTKETSNPPGHRQNLQARIYLPITIIYCGQTKNES